jgi:hypothetical protein
MTYYYLQTGLAQQGQVWKISDDEAIRVGVANARRGPNTYFARDEKRTIWETLAQRCPAWFGPEAAAKLHRVTLSIGEYYHRMARPLDQQVHNPNQSPGYSPDVLNLKNEIATAQGQLIVLVRQIQRICQTVHPEGEALNTFGHDIRNLLILACTEVEAHWRGVLDANATPGGSRKFTTNDYVKLSIPMKLSEYSVRFPFYPWLPPLRPFQNWGVGDAPTREIDWYAAYNEVKHDRQARFSRATLANAFNAVTACAVMMWAQFGNGGYFGEHAELRYFFKLETPPTWTPADAYIHPYETSGWVARTYDFETLPSREAC